MLMLTEYQPRTVWRYANVGRPVILGFGSSGSMSERLRPFNRDMGKGHESVGPALALLS